MCSTDTLPRRAAINGRAVGLRLLAALLCLGWCAVAAAEACPPPRSEPRCVALGRSYLAQRDYAQAIESFQAAIEHTATPTALLGLAKAQRLSEQRAEARLTYQIFLRLYPTHQHRGEVEAHLSQLAAPAPVIAPPQISPPLPLAAMPASPPSSASRPWHQRWWWWTLVGVAAAGAVAGTVAGVVVAQRPADGPNLIDLRF